jgi:ABC-type transport system involved in Fe-S cluster assembly fused permease/ATPase subunit
MKTHIACYYRWDYLRRRGKSKKEEVEETGRAAIVDDFVKDDGYETNLASAGIGLSGGQKQRLALAKARLWNPTVLIHGMFIIEAFFSILTLKQTDEASERD